MAEWYDFYERKQQEEEAAYATVAAASDYSATVKSAFALYSAKNTFSPGQLVQWKRMMRNRPFPTESAPAIVVEYLAEPQIRDRDGDLMPEPNDVVIGLVDGSRVFRVFAVPSKRLTLWEEEDAVRS